MTKKPIFTDVKILFNYFVEEKYLVNVNFIKLLNQEANCGCWKNAQETTFLLNLNELNINITDLIWTNTMPLMTFNISRTLCIDGVWIWNKNIVHLPLVLINLITKLPTRQGP